MTHNAGFSLRESLVRQGVTTEEAKRCHLGLAYDMIQATGGKLRAHRYKVDANNPNAPVPNMG